MAASLAISASWHLLALAVLAMAAHPFELPLQTQAIELQILPPLPQEEPKETVVLRPRIESDAETVPVRAPPSAPPEPTQAPQPVPLQSLETVKPAPAAPPKAPDVERRPAPTQPRTTDVARLPELTPPAPSEPLAEARPAPPALANPPELERPSAPPKRVLSTAAPSLDLSKPAAAEPAPAAETPVLTNQQVVPGPVAVRPRERSSTPQQTAIPGSEGVPTPGGAAAAGGTPAAGGSAGGLPKPNAAAGVLGGYDLKGTRSGMSMRLGCATPDTYRLTPEDRAACMQRLGALAQGAHDLGPNIPANKQADYDHQVACRNAYTRQATPGSGAASDGTSIAGLGANPSLKDCRPGDR